MLGWLLHITFLKEHESQEYDQQYFLKFQNLKVHFHYIAYFFPLANGPENIVFDNKNAGVNLVLFS